MTIITVVCVPEGIAMTADSRLIGSYNWDSLQNIIPNTLNTKSSSHVNECVLNKLRGILFFAKNKNPKLTDN